jgi:hypothetical protein
MDLKSHKNTLFDPNFEYMLNIDFLTEKFFIWNVEEGKRDEDIKNEKGELKPFDCKENMKGGR